jgi:ABC-type lipoprotein export system ATPase subunit
MSGPGSAWGFLGRRQQESAAPVAEPPPATAPVLSARGLSKVYGEGETAAVALGGLDLDLFPGELLAVIGPSGSGKSTLLHLLAGIDSPSSGSVEVDGRDLASMSDAEAAHFRAKRIGFVLQRDNLIPSLTIRENAAAPLMLAGVPRGEALQRASELLERVGLGHRLDALPADVSGGEAQRAAVARACTGEPLLVFADEPTGALDRQNGQGVVELLCELVADVGAAGLIVTHDPAVAGAAERTLRLLDGLPSEP